MDQIGVVWNKTYGPGAIANLKPVAGGGYVAAGRNWNSSTAAGIGRCEGLIIEIDESGNEIRRATAIIPQRYRNNHADLSGASASFSFAFKTDDGGYLAFGSLTNSNAPSGEKEFDWATGTANGGPYLTNGVWIVKFNSQLQVVSDTITRGRSLSNGWRMADGNFIVGGFDAADPAGSNNTSKITLLRKYNQNGVLVPGSDKRGGYREINALYQYPGTDDFLAVTPDNVLRINSSLTVTPTAITNSLFQGVTNPQASSITPSFDGGFFINTRLNSDLNPTINYNNGVGIYKISSANTHVYNKKNIPADSIFEAPFYLSGSGTSAKYIGAMRSCLNNSCSASYMYELTDNGKFTFRVGDPYPDGTTLRIAGQSDGFFSSGSSAAGLAAIAKLSTCANFILNVGSTEEQLFVDKATRTGSLAGRNIAWSGQQGTVSYSWKLTEITPGGVTSLGTASGTDIAIPAKQFTLAPGKESAILQYTIIATDSYVNNGVPQTCQRTENILVKISLYPDNIIDADCIVDPPEQKWSIRKARLSDGVHSMSTPLVADLDGDSIPEIIVPKVYAIGNAYQSNGFIVANAVTGASRTIPTVLFGTHGQPVAIANVQADPKTNKDAYIFLQGIDYKLYCYNGATSALVTTWGTGGSVTLPDNPNVSPNIPKERYIIQLADLNADGIPELIAGPHIYNARTGDRLLSGTFEAGGLGLASPHTQFRTSTGAYSMFAVGNVTGGNSLQIVAGNRVYSPSITNPTGIDGNTWTVSATAQTGSSVKYPDGPTILTDFDNNGELDVCVIGSNVPLGSTIPSGYSFQFYVWNPRTGAIIAYAKEYGTGKAVTIPYAGDLDGDGFVDVCFAENTGEFGFFSYHYDPSKPGNIQRGTESLEFKQTSGFTLFDFNQDKSSELVYRSDYEFMIVDGATLTPVHPDARFEMFSGTLTEYPVVADVDNDGSAEIIITEGKTDWHKSSDATGWVTIIKSKETEKWAPARKVWNQWAYNGTLINEDMTVPKNPINPATVFPGKDKVLGTSDDVRPYNSFLQQYTMLNRYGKPLWTLPNAEYVNNTPVYDYYQNGDSLRIIVDVENQGDAPFQSPFYISVYKKAGAATTLVKTESIEQVISQDETVQKVISIKNFSSLLPFDSLIVQLNDNNLGHYIQPECDTTRNRTSEVGWKVMRVNPDLATVQKYYSVDIPVLANDSLPASLFSGSFSLGDSVSIPPTAGTLTAVGSGASSKLVYTNHGNPLANNIDSFQYRITFLHPATSAYRTLTAWVYIYVLDDLNGAAGCYGQPHTVNLSARPAGTTFDWWYNTGGTPLSPLQENPRTITGITADTIFQIRPNVPLTRYSRWGEFPRGYFTIKPANTGGTVATMRWTGLADSLWHNPANWVAVRSMANGSMYETPVSYAPTKCVNVIIPSIVGSFPELVDSAWCNDILMEDRAMLKNPHVLNYRNASVELKLKPSERDRFIMWSAPLSQMVTGDYHYKSKTGEPQFGDFFMNFFQQSNPDNSGSAAARGNFTTTFGSVSQSLQLGKAFNLRVVTTSLSRDSILRFPGETDTYNGIQLDPRPGKYKFVTQGVAQNVLGRFDLPVYSGLGSSYDNSGWKLIQVVNPYMAYLRADSFLLYNPALQSGYYYWNGELDGSFTTVGVSGTGNRFVYTEQSTASLPNLIAPLQSFFVAKTDQNSQVSTVVMSPRWTTASPPASYTLRSTQVTSGGILYIKAIQGSRTSSAALVYDPEATSKADLPVLVYNEIPLTLYAFSPGRDALSIRTSNDFQSRATDLGLRVMNAGEMKLEFSGLSTFGHDVYLQDKQLGKTINLQNNPVYTFTVAKPGADAIELNDRFSLEMAYTGKGIVTGNESAPAPATLQVSSKDGYLNVQSQGEKIDQLQIYSLTGKLIYSNSSSSDRFSIPLPGGVYIVRGLTGTTYCTEKAVVR